MASAFSDLYVISDRYANIQSSDDAAFELANCSQCAGTQVAVIAFDQSSTQQWLRCVNCRHPIIRVNGTIYPPARPLRAPAGIPGVEAAVWEEIRSCLSVGANTAAVMLCRKLLLHVAVTHGLDAQDARGRAPSFVQAVDHLEAEGLFTRRMRPWVDRIKDVGNEANHEISPVTPEVALDVATFTEQLLRLAYEMDALMSGTT